MNLFILMLGNEVYKVSYKKCFVCNVVFRNFNIMEKIFFIICSFLRILEMKGFLCI